MSDDQPKPTEAQRGAAVYSDSEESRWRGGDTAPGSATDGDPSGWAGGADQGERRPGDAETSLTGQSGDSVRDQASPSEDARALRQNSGGTTAGRPPVSADGS